MNSSQINLSQHLAIDLGGESGRVIIGSFDGDRVALQEVYRFPNGPVTALDGIHWDISALFSHSLAGLAYAVRASHGNLTSLAIDTWGCDYGLLDATGRLIGDPFHYRDSRAAGWPERAFGMVPAADVFAATGSQTSHVNTLFQLLADADHQRLNQAETMLMIPDLVTFWLTGERGAEATISSTSQLFDPCTRGWAWHLIDQFDLPRRLFQPVIEPGVIRGNLNAVQAEDAGLKRQIPVISVGSHDTASAFAATQAAPGVLIISSGTWSLIGVETTAPIISDAVLKANFTNEAGVSGANRLLRNACGLWLIQDCRRSWERDGTAVTYDDLTAEAAAAPAHLAIIDPDDSDFMLPGQMPSAIQEFCIRTGQTVPADRGSIVRVALESLALNYRSIMSVLEKITGREFDTIQIAGGGSRNALLCQFTADATGRPVVAGPEQATALGNIMVQAMALGEVSSLAEIRVVIQRSAEPVLYTPDPTIKPAWDEAYGRFQQLRSRG